MTAVSKKNKQKNSHCVKGCLKDKGKGVKRYSFFTSSQRQYNNRFANGA